MHEKECSLNLGGHAVRVKEKFLGMDLPDLGSEGLGASTFLSYKSHVPLLEVNVCASAFWFKVIFNCL